MPPKPTVSLVIPVYNEAESIEMCLERCMDQSPAFSEIIVVDNNSTDETVKLVENIAAKTDVSIRLLHEPLQGIEPARNTGFAAATSDVIGRIDADTMLEDGWVAAVQSTFTDTQVAAASGPVLYHDMPLPQVGFAIDERIRNTLYKYAKDHKFLFGTNMAIRRSAWDGVGPYVVEDRENLYHEDISLALALFQNGYKIMYAPEMVAGMSARRIEDSPVKYYRYVMRFERTFKAYGLKSMRARIPIFIYLLIYFPVRTIRKFYDGDKRQFTLDKLKKDVLSIRQKLS